MSDTRPVEPPVSIRAEVSLADLDTCKFTASRTVHPGGPFFFENQEEAAGSPLVVRLFQLPGVVHVLVAGNVVTVGKASSAPWAGLKASIGAVIRSQLLTGIGALLESPLRAGTGSRSNAKVRAAIQGLLDREVNRSIASHGGQISIVDVRDGRLLIAMSGGCQGCTASQVTLKNGFELMVRRIAPEIVEIVDTTDHAAGKKPFYPQAGEAR
jgi:NFU1 iron-sulfur cluster scaffold homolog, mitochondrial